MIGDASAIDEMLNSQDPTWDRERATDVLLQQFTTFNMPQPGSNKHSSVQTLPELLDTVDVDRTGRLAIDGLLEIACIEWRAVLAWKEDQIKGVFANYDTNKDGRLDLNVTSPRHCSLSSRCEAAG